MKTVISASRRTDIPAWYCDWLLEGISRGSVDVPNPYSGVVSTVDLTPENVHTLVLWSKNFGPFLECADAFSRYHQYFLFTINDMPGLEPGVPSLGERIDQARELAARYGPERIGWRYDPVVFGSDGPVSTVGAFGRIGSELASFGVRRAIFSFLDIYGKVKKRIRDMNIDVVDPPDDAKSAYAADLSRAAGEIGMTLVSCSEHPLDVGGIARSSCIDGRLLGHLRGEAASCAKDGGQRKLCNCTASRDIGSYRDMPCRGGCLYCYANPVISA